MPVAEVEIARHMGLTQAHIRELLHKSMKKDLSEYDTVEQFEADYNEFVLPRASEAAEKVIVDGQSVRDLRAKQELLKLYLLELEFEDRKNSTYRRETVDKAWSAAAQMIRNSLMGLPARHAPVMAAKYGADAHTMLMDLEQMLREFCERIPNELYYAERKPIGRPRKGG